MKKIFAIVLAAVLLLALVGCGPQGEPEGAPAVTQEELDAVKAELAAAQARITELTASQNSAASEKTVYALNATIDGQSAVTISGETSLTAQAVLEEGQAVDHWELNGEVQPDAAGETFAFTASDDTIVEAVLRAEKKITAINCKIRFLDENGKAAGDSYEEFVFEQPYTNPVTGEEVTDGTITVQLKAEVPATYTVDYWIINGVPYDYNSTVTSFVVENLDEATEYEVVFKEIYYKVTCVGCNINGKKELWVRPGTTLTAVRDGGYYAEFAINGVAMNNRWRDPYVKQWTFTVNDDTKVEAYAIIN